MLKLAGLRNGSSGTLQTHCGKQKLQRETECEPKMQSDHDKVLPAHEMQFLREKELAERWKVSLRTLQRWRAEGSGPAYISIGGTIRYLMEDVRAYEDARRHGGEKQQ